ncbi:hypothetical protein RIR_jg16331.t1 [Rhizophagus irregularis DAOM 181602=DAOM 197198]|uniref:Uncharacterized protein n=1 Tax=Rhizophagus irregularis (strain DAOM 181602 / DAOM 197198 / MUCL 43194) TaxID=747089 RepID=U9TGD3_RHIID|nr:hypothetical protein RIR_jg16331.t1 [Rhizophagus irregularis DAOM 181602=DAOM 197198]
MSPKKDLFYCLWSETSVLSAKISKSKIEKTFRFLQRNHRCFDIIVEKIDVLYSGIKGHEMMFATLSLADMLRQIHRSSKSSKMLLIERYIKLILISQQTIDQLPYVLNQLFFSY